MITDWIVTIHNIDDETICDEFIVRNVDEPEAQKSAEHAVKKRKGSKLYWVITQVEDYEGEL